MSAPGPDPRDAWERGFDDGWAARIEGRKRPGLRWRLALIHGGEYWRGWREGWRVAGDDGE